MFRKKSSKAIKLIDFVINLFFTILDIEEFRAIRKLIVKLVFILRCSLIKKLPSIIIISQICKTYKKLNISSYGNNKKSTIY